MNRDSLVVVGVVLITLIVLGSAYMAVSRGVAPSLLGTESGSGKTAGTTTTSASGTSTQTKTTTEKAPFEFKSIFLKKKEFSITYDFYENLKKKGTGSLYVKGETKTRFDYSTSQGQFITIKNENAHIFCFKQPNKDWECFQITKEGQYPGQGEGTKINSPVDEGEEFTNPVYNGTRKYAGKTCYCYYVTRQQKMTVNGKEKAGTATVEICVTSDGIPAYYLFLWKSSDGNDTTRSEGIAKTISYSVPDTVFNPPAEPKSFPNQ